MFEQWIIAMTVLLTLFHPKLTESSSNCEDNKMCDCLIEDRNIPIKTVDKNATVFCPDLEEDEELISTSLHKGETELHFVDIRNKSYQSWQRFQMSFQNSTVFYMIQGTVDNDTGIYSCTIHTKIRTKTKQTVLLIKDAQQPSEPSPTCHTLPLSVGCGVVILYNLLITAVVFFLSYKIKNQEPPENPYINSRPEGFRRCR
ncbi:uncharacterized protein LOC127659243 isoform X2 [Xyrauchen texanus]|uniref:uncharacterized protein LOC127659243 isoform X2 n=1 Tax=Xyrauchen texanus TaxID=154827 RepID=UPI002241F2B2|nr:uncharacterized protein LOC127659243 isoform X2 [Xyrauchen texanus]